MAIRMVKEPYGTDSTLVVPRTPSRAWESRFRSITVTLYARPAYDIGTRQRLRRNDNRVTVM